MVPGPAARPRPLPLLPDHTVDPLLSLAAVHAVPGRRRARAATGFLRAPVLSSSPPQQADLRRARRCRIEQTADLVPAEPMVPPEDDLELLPLAGGEGTTTTAPTCARARRQESGLPMVRSMVSTDPTQLNDRSSRGAVDRMGCGLTLCPFSLAGSHASHTAPRLTPMG